MSHMLDDGVDLITAEIAEMSLHNGNPGDNGANEISGSGDSGAYVRLEPSYGAASGGSATAPALEYSTPNNQTVTHIGLWRAGAPTTFWRSREITGQPVDANSDGRIDVTPPAIGLAFVG